MAGILDAYGVMTAYFSRALGIPEPQLLSYGREPAAVRMFGGPRAFLHGRFLVGTLHLRGGGSAMFVNEDTTGLLTPAGLGALAAHESGHAADWFLALRVRMAGALPGPMSCFMAADGSATAPETFADRVAAHLVGRSAVIALHEEASAILDGADPVSLASFRRLGHMSERPVLPPSLRVRAALDRAAGSLTGR